MELISVPSMSKSNAANERPSKQGAWVMGRELCVARRSEGSNNKKKRA
jgi:hypothetical protein